MHDVWAIGTNVYFKVYGIVIFLFMCTTMNLSFTWEISILGMSIVGLLMALLFFFFYPTKFLWRCVKMHTFFFYAQNPDFHKQGLCYYLKILYL